MGHEPSIVNVCGMFSGSPPTDVGLRGVPHWSVAHGIEIVNIHVDFLDRAVQNAVLVDIILTSSQRIRPDSILGYDQARARTAVWQEKRCH
jgi:hypothetical protein